MQTITRRQFAVWALAIAIGLGTGYARAQEYTLAFYIVPKIGSGTFVDPYRPKYIGDMVGVQWSAMDYGLDPTFLVGANLTAEQHAFVAGQSDAYAIPPLETAVGGNPALNQTVNRLEQSSIPGSWVQATTTYRVLTGRVGRFCLILQRLHGRHNKRLFEPGTTLDSNLTETLLQQLIDVGTSFGLNTAGFSTALTVREALILLADQLPPFSLAGEAF